MKLAVAPAQYDQSDQAQVRRELLNADQQNVKRGAAQSALLLQDSSGQTWKGTISTSGVVSWAVVART